MLKRWFMLWVWVGFVGLSPIHSNEVMHEADEFDDDFFYAINREDGFITREDIAEELGWIFLSELSGRTLCGS